MSKPIWGEGTLADTGIDSAGWFLLAAGLFLRLWATLYIGGKKSLTFVTDGPYAMCRHPLYLGSFFIVLSLVFFLQSLIVLAAVGVVAVLHVAVIIPSEERHLQEAFGEAYRTYARRTPGLVPRPGNLRRPGMMEIKVAELLREAGRAFGCLMIAAGAEIVAECRTQPWWPVLFHLP